MDDFDGMDDEEGDLSFVRCAIFTSVSVYLGTPSCSQGSEPDEFALQTHNVENRQPAGVRQSQDSPPSLIRRAWVWNIQPHSHLLCLSLSLSLSLSRSLSLSPKEGVTDHLPSPSLLSL